MHKSDNPAPVVDPITIEPIENLKATPKKRGRPAGSKNTVSKIQHNTAEQLEEAITEIQENTVRGEAVPVIEPSDETKAAMVEADDEAKRKEKEQKAFDKRFQEQNRPPTKADPKYLRDSKGSIYRWDGESFVRVDPQTRVPIPRIRMNKKERLRLRREFRSRFGEELTAAAEGESDGAEEKTGN